MATEKREHINRLGESAERKYLVPSPLQPEVAGLNGSRSRLLELLNLHLRLGGRWATRFMWRLPGCRAALRGVRTAVGRHTRAEAATETAAGAMERAVVRCVPSEPKLSLSFALADGSHKNMQRDQSEPLGRALSRIATNALKGHAKAATARKSRKNRPNASGGVACAGAWARAGCGLRARDEAVIPGGARSG